MSEAALAQRPLNTESRWAWIRPAETRWLPILLGTIVLGVFQYLYGILGSWSVLPAAIGGCIVTEIVPSLVARRRFPGLQSAYMSGVSLSLLLRPQADLLWPFVVGAPYSRSRRSTRSRTRDGISGVLPPLRSG